jgi:TatD DNase family protein
MDVEDCLQRFFSHGAAFAVDVAVNTRGWAQRLDLAHRVGRLYLSAGVHPSEAAHAQDIDWESLEVQWQHPLTVAVGEIGLDWFRGRHEEGAQRSVFRRQLCRAAELGLPVILHNRSADSEVLEDLREVGWKGRGILHCFSSDQVFAQECLDLGFLISFAGNVTYPSAGGLREVARWVPKDRILIETDAPYLSPQGKRGTPNEPLNAGLTAEVLANLRGESLSEFLACTRENLAGLLGIGPTDQAQ